MDYRLENKIDEYHAGRMTSSEMDAFEEELSSDPSIQAESDFQRDIIDGLKEFRKAELKTRLSSIDVTPAWFEFVQQSTLLKSFGGVAVATLVGTGVYFMAESNEEIEELEPITIDAPKELSLSIDWDIKPVKLSVLDVEDVKSTASFNTKSVELVDFSEVVSETTTEETKNEASLSLDFAAPTVENIKDEEALEVSSLDELPRNGSAKEDEEPIEVDHEVTKNLNVKYKYYDGKLFLSGDFDRAPYEILEINSANGRRIYVKYLNKYYKIGVTDKLTTLPQVFDVNVIKELELLRQNK